MTESQISVAGHLVVEAGRIRSALSTGNPVAHYVPSLFGSDCVPWTKGLNAYFRLISRVDTELAYIPGGRREKFEVALNSMKEALHADKFSVPAKQIRDSHFSVIHIERIESINDLLVQAGRSISVDSDRARYVVDELNDLLQQIRSGPNSEIDDFLIEKLEELRFVLDGYSLFGPEGVRASVAEIIGTIAVEKVARGGLSKVATQHAKGVWRVAKGALDTLVYAHSGVDAIEWAGSGVAGFLEG